MIGQVWHTCTYTQPVDCGHAGYEPITDKGFVHAALFCNLHSPSFLQSSLSLSLTHRGLFISLSHTYGRQVKPSCYSSEVLPHKSHTLPIRYLCDAPTSPCHTLQLTQLYSGYLTPERVREGEVGRGWRQTPPLQKKGFNTSPPILPFGLP